MQEGEINLFSESSEWKHLLVIQVIVKKVATKSLEKNHL